MPGSKVFFTDMHCKIGDSLLAKLGRVVRAAGIESIDMDRKFVAIKMHFGEYGNLAFLRPNYAKVIADIVKEKGGTPFLTDCNTLYIGSRRNAVDHLECASMNGFNPVTTGCQIIIGDGLKGTDDVEIHIDGEYVKTAKIGRAIADSDVLITLTHFKGHATAGIGGAIKNLAMGCASRRGKKELHIDGVPEVDRSRCVGCGRCVSACGEGSVRVEDGKAIISDSCVGCRRCVGACPRKALCSVKDRDGWLVDAKMVEYAAAVVRDRPCFHVSIICDVSPFCDCAAWNDVPIVPNVGMLASFDPIALDRACVDLVQKQPVIPGSRVDQNCRGVPPGDVLGCNQPGTRWQNHFEHAEALGLGSGEYDLVEVRRLGSRGPGGHNAAVLPGGLAHLHGEGLAGEDDERHQPSVHDRHRDRLRMRDGQQVRQRKRDLRGPVLRHQLRRGRHEHSDIRQEPQAGLDIRDGMTRP